MCPLTIHVGRFYSISFISGPWAHIPHAGEFSTQRAIFLVTHESVRPNDRIFDIPMVRSVSHLTGSIQFPLVPELENLSQNLRVGATETKNPKFKFAHGETFWKKRFPLLDLQLELKPI